MTESESRKETRVKLPASLSGVELYGGRYIARERPEPPEGQWQPKRPVILEFPSIEQAKAWLNSPEYAPARALHHHFATSNMVVIEGLT